MEQMILKDLYCFQCSLQFEKMSIYEMHLSIMHNYKRKIKAFDTIIKTEPEEIESSIDMNNGQSKHTDKQELSQKVTSVNDEKKSSNKITHTLTFNKKKSFSCKICSHSFSQKGHLRRHVASIHEEKKSFKCEKCDYKCSQKGSMKQHVASVHERK